MADSPFSAAAAAPSQFALDRLLKRPDLPGAAAAIERALASAWPHPTREGVVAALRAHNVSGREARRICLGLFAQALRTFAANHRISPDESEHLRVLQRVLGLIQRDVGEAYLQVAEEMYSNALSQALDEPEGPSPFSIMGIPKEDLTREERARLDLLTDGLRIEPARRELLHREQAQVILQRMLRNSGPNRSVTAPEGESMQAMAEKYGTPMDFEIPTKAHFDRFALLWQIENGELPTVTAPITLPKGETCHYYSTARLHAHAESAELTSGEEAQTIVRGLSYRAGTVPKRPAPAGKRDVLDEGTLYITSKRMMFVGTQREISLRHADLASLQPYADGFGVERATGDGFILRIDGDVEVATTIAAEALARS